MQNRTDSEKGEQPTQPPMCQTNCGFFANPSCNGYCSKCFSMEQKKMLSMQNPQDTAMESSSHPPLSSLLSPDTSPPLEGAAPNVPSVMSTGKNSSNNNDPGVVPSSTSPPTAIDQGARQMDVDTSVLQTPHQQILSEGGGYMEMGSIKVSSDQVQVIEGQQQQQQPQFTQEIQTPQVQKQDALDTPVQKNKGRCWFCKKKVGIQGVQCKCGFVYCLSHRQPEDHCCNFDFREFDRKRLASSNPQVVGSKMDHRV
eukprot:TRINITY_DN6823_c0_g1_i1.p1 TRINITY_DN6823_c0_g1~~TRINITY_DN6823_c0_g1_i1.p1  ORF type:complete len:255 (-),score=39.71 TRINITY_DN6823_c0_g1_i1:965-1729(-)